METIALNLRPPLLRDAHFSLQMTFNCCLDVLSKKPCTSSTSATKHFTAASRTRTKRCAEAGEPRHLRGAGQWVRTAPRHTPLPHHHPTAASTAQRNARKIPRVPYRVHCQILVEEWFSRHG